MESSSLSESARLFFAASQSNFNDWRRNTSTSTDTLVSWNHNLPGVDSAEHLLIMATVFLWIFLIFRYVKALRTQHKEESGKEQKTKGGPAQVERKKIFLRHAEKDYGYADTSAGFIDHWRPKELPHLISPIRISDEGGSTIPVAEDREVYLDYAGSALPTQSQLERIYRSQTILANPHSSGPAASRTSLLIEQAKKKILDHFGGNPGVFAGMQHPKASADDMHPGYDIVFTSGATESLQIVSERFPWSQCNKCARKSLLMYPQNSHTSVVGMRGPVLRNGADFLCKPMYELLQDIHKGNISGWNKSDSLDSCDCCEGRVNNLVVVPAECNFGGERPDIQSALRQVNSSSSSNCRWWTMVDIAKAAATGPVNLKELNPDFACVSFYKLFGEPTGLGCLFVKHTAEDVLMGSRQDSETIHDYFGGGSVDAILPCIDFGVSRSEPSTLASLSNGTVHFRGIVSLLHGFEELDRRGGMNAIRRHSVSLAKELVRRLTALRHENGRPAVIIYGAWGQPLNEDLIPGPTVAFNILLDDGSYVGYNEVTKLAALNHPPLQLRSGCFCNPGACQLALDLSNQDVINNFKISGHVCGDQIDIINGRPTGAIRASFGKESLWEDLDALVTFIERLFVMKRVDDDLTSDSRRDGGPKQVVLTELYIFPIKSCAAQRASRWAVDRKTGKPVFDREFALVDSSGAAMRLQAYPKMAFLRPTIDLRRRSMTITAPGQSTLELSLDDESKYTKAHSIVRVCGSRCGGMLWGDYEVSEWFSQFLGVRCWLARYSAGHSGLAEVSCVQTSALRNPQVAFANEQPILLISEHAVDALNDVLESQNQKRVDARHFRPNMVVRLIGRADNSRLHAEDCWCKLEVTEKGVKFDVVGQCARCSMVDVDPTTGMKGKTLQALADYRSRNGQITFGIFLKGSSEKLCSASESVWLEEGDILCCE